MNEFVMQPVGVVRSTRLEPEDDAWDAERSHIEVLEPYGARSLMGLNEFSHCIVVFMFDKATWTEDKISRHPRGNKNWPEVGIFAQRAKDRPNRIGITVCEITGVEGNKVLLTGLDAIDGTPVLDIKPYMSEFDARSAVEQPDWSRELMRGYW